MRAQLAQLEALRARTEANATADPRVAWIYLALGKGEVQMRRAHRALAATLDVADLAYADLGGGGDNKTAAFAREYIMTLPLNAWVHAYAESAWTTATGWVDAAAYYPTSAKDRFLALSDTEMAARAGAAFRAEAAFTALPVEERYEAYTSTFEPTQSISNSGAWEWKWDAVRASAAEWIAAEADAVWGREGADSVGVTVDKLKNTSPSQHAIFTARDVNPHILFLDTPYAFTTEPGAEVTPERLREEDARIGLLADAIRKSAAHQTAPDDEASVTLIRRAIANAVLASRFRRAAIQVAIDEKELVS